MGCAQKAVDYLKAMISCGRIETCPATKIESYDSGSLAYSWNMGSYHFVQLHNYPTYRVPSLGMPSSMAWLKKDLDRGKTANKKTAANLHDLGQHFKEAEYDAFEALLTKYNVAGIFCGHVISSFNLGYQGLLGSSNIPIFRGGHGGEVNRNKFLLVEFAETHYRVASITSSEGTAKFVQGGSQGPSQFDCWGLLIFEQSRNLLGDDFFCNPKCNPSTCMVQSQAQFKIC